LGDCGDDGNGSEPAISLYLDGTGAMVPYVDVGFAIRTFQELGAPHGLLLNLDKTKIHMTLDPEIPADDPALLQALELIKPATRLTWGTTYLSSPFG